MINHNIGGAKNFSVKVEKPCEREGCETIMVLTPSVARKKKYCCMACRTFESRPVVDKTCEWCGEGYKTRKPNQKYCTQPCSTEALAQSKRDYQKAKSLKPKKEVRYSYMMFPGIETQFALYQVATIVCQQHQVELCDLKGESKLKRFVVPRFEIFYLFKKKYPKMFSTTSVGAFFNRDHATVIHGLRKTQDAIDIYPDYKEKIEGYLEVINN